MRVRGWFLPTAIGLLSGWLAACAPLRAQQTSAQPALSLAPPAISIAERYLFEAANAERAQRGIAPLRWSGELYVAAGAHAGEMAARQNISHQYAGEPELAERGRRAGVRFSRISENVAMAPTAVRIHDAWMNSPGHRENLLDPVVTVVAIRVLRRGDELYAVQDFAHTVEFLSLEQQEGTVAALLEGAAPLDLLPASDAARATCGMETGYAGSRRPLFVMRYTASDLGRLPEQLRDRLATGRYHEAAVGACAPSSAPFTSYSIAVLLYP